MVQAIRETPNITGYSQVEWLSFSDVLVAEVDGVFAGVAASKDIGKYWTYLAVIFVFPEFRGQGIGRALFDDQLMVIKKRWRRGFTCSRNPEVIKWMQYAGMTLTNKLLRSPLPLLLYFATDYLTPYRIGEFLRKRKLFKNEPDWVYGSLRS